MKKIKNDLISINEKLEEIKKSLAETNTFKENKIEIKISEENLNQNIKEEDEIII